MSWEWWHPSMDMLPKQEIKCTCGTTIAMGADYPPERHSDFCDVYIDYKKKEKKDDIKKQN